MQHYFRLHSSRIFAAFLFFGYLLALSVVLLISVNIWLKLLLGAILSISLLFHLFRDAWLLASSSYVAIHYNDGDIMLVSRAGQEISGNLARNSFVTPLLTVLNVLPEGNKKVHSVVIFPDSLSRERFRELRVLLKWANNIHL